MWVIYANTADGDFDYLCEDKIVYGEFFMSNNVGEAKIFTSKEEAIKFSDILYDKIKFDIKRNLFVAKLTIGRGTSEYVGYYGGDLARRF
jgi:hypothetical protein